MAEVIELSTEKLNEVIDRRVNEILGEKGLEEKIEESGEAIRKDFKEWSAKSESEKRRHEHGLMRSALLSTNSSERARAREHKGTASIKAATFMLLAVQAQRDRKSFAEAAEDANKAGMPEVAKALASSSLTDGGVLIPEAYAPEFISGVYDNVVVRELGAQLIQVPSGSINVGRLNGSTTHQWVGEGQGGDESQASFGSLKLNARKGWIITRVSNDLLRRAGNVSQLIVDDMQSVAAVALDAAYLRADGTEHRPNGIFNQCHADNISNSAGATLADVDADAFDLMLKVRANMPGQMVRRGGWVTNLEEIFALMKFRTGDGYPIFRAELAAGTYHGFAIRQTGSVPTNLGDGFQTQLAFADFAEVLIGDTLAPRIDFNDSAGFTTDETLIRLIHESDIALKRDKALAVKNNVNYAGRS